MKKLYAILITIAAILSLAAPATAATFPNADAGFEIRIPDAWKTETAGNAIKAELLPAGASEGVTMLLDVIEAEGADAAFETAVAEISKEFGSITLRSTVDTEINGIPAIFGEFISADKKTSIFASIFLTPAGKIMRLYYFAPAADEAKYEKEIMDIVGSVKPVAPAPAAEEKK